MSDYSKNSVLALYKILLMYTDEEHPISMQGILTYMETEGYPCSEDSILRYIKQLRSVFDVDIISGRGRNAKYFIGARLLEKEELKLIVDSINASNFIEETIAAKMIGKLKETMSIYDAEELDRNVLGVSIAKAENRKILYNVNKLQEAMAADVQISFNNLVWNKNKKLEKKYDRKNTWNPWALIWANDRYYLYGYDLKERDGKLGERHYRVDKLTDIELLDTPRAGKSQFRKFDANTYVARRIGMFSGEETKITVRIPEGKIGPFIDQFGKKIAVSEDTDGKLMISFQAVPSNLLLGWFIGLGQVEIIGPESAVEGMISLIESNRKFYLEKN